MLYYFMIMKKNSAYNYQLLLCLLFPLPLYESSSLLTVQFLEPHNLRDGVVLDGPSKHLVYHEHSPIIVGGAADFWLFAPGLQSASSCLWRCYGDLRPACKLDRNFSQFPRLGLTILLSFMGSLYPSNGWVKDDCWPIQWPLENASWV